MTFQYESYAAQAEESNEYKILTICERNNTQLEYMAARPNKGTLRDGNDSKCHII